FWLGRRKFVHIPPKPGGRIGLLDTLCSVSLFLSFGHLFASVELIEPYVEGNPALKWAILGSVSLGFLILGLVLFLVRQRIQPDDGFFAITLHVLATHLGFRPRQPGSPAGFWGPGYAHYGEATDGPIAVFKVISIFFLVSVFWALF